MRAVGSRIEVICHEYVKRGSEWEYKSPVDGTAVRVFHFFGL